MSQTLSLPRGEYALFITPPVAGVDYTGTPLPTVSYQWRKNGVAIVGQTSATIAGVWVEKEGGTVDLVDGDAISIDIILSNVVDVSTKTISATIDSAIPAPVISPVSIRQLSGGTYQTVTSLANTDIGEQVIVASNSGGTVTTTPPVLTTYQWRRNAIAIAGATAQTYTLQSADADSVIDCRVTAANSGGTTTATATVVVGTVADAGGWTALTPSADSRLIYVSNDGNDAAAANVKGRGYYLPSDPEIGPDPTNPVGPIVAYRNPQRGLMRLPSGPRPDWVMFKRGEVFVPSELLDPTIAYTYGLVPSNFGTIFTHWWNAAQNRFERDDYGKVPQGRSESERYVITAWGSPSDARPRIAGGLNFAGHHATSGRIMRNSAVVSIEASINMGLVSAPAVGRKENVLVEDCVMRSFACQGGPIVLRRCVVSGNFSPSGHNQGFFIRAELGSDERVTIEECVFDRNGYKDNPEQPRSWRGQTTSAGYVAISVYGLHPNPYPFALQVVELWDVASNTMEWTGMMPVTTSDSVGSSESKAHKKYYEFPSPTPLVASDPERMSIVSNKWFDASGNVNARYDFEVYGAFTRTGVKRIRIFNTTTEQYQQFDFTIGTRPQQLRTYFDRNIYVSTGNGVNHAQVTLRGNIFSRGGGGGSVQMRQGGVADRNLFMWNEDAGFNSSGAGGIYKDNVILHDDHMLPPGGWGKAFGMWNSDSGDSDLKYVMDGNIAAHFHRGNNGEPGFFSRETVRESNGAPLSGSFWILNNIMYRSTGSRGISIERNTPESVTVSGNEIAVLSGGVVGGSLTSTTGTPYQIDGNLYHSQSATPFGGNRTFEQWQSIRADLDDSSSFLADFAAFKAAAGWTAPERDIVSYMQSVDPTYVVNEDVYVDEDAAGLKQDVRQKVWEVLVNTNSEPMTEAQAKQVARRYHAFITFIQRAKANRKGAWDTRWTAEAVNNYIREGFGKTPISGPYDTRSLATRLAEYAS